MKKLLLFIFLSYGFVGLAQEKNDSLSSKMAEKARVFGDALQFDSAMYYYDLSIKRLDSLGDKRMYYLTLINKAYAINQMGKAETAIELLEEVRQAAADFDGVNVMFEVYRNLAIIYESQRNYSKALEQYQLAEDNLTHDGTEDTAEREFSLYVGRGVSYAQSDRLSDAEKQWKTAVAIMDSIGIRDDRVAIVLNNLANLATYSGFSEQALLYYHRATDIYIEKLGDSNHPNLIQSYYNMALVYTELSLFHKSLEYTHRAKNALTRVAPKHPFLITIGLLISDSYNILNQVDTAFHYANEAHKLSLQIHGERHASTIGSYLSLGEVVSRRGNPELGMKYMENARDLLTQLENKADLEMTSAVYHALGTNQMGNGKEKEGIENLKLSVKQAHQWVGPKGNDPAVFSNDLAEGFLSLYQYDEALEYYQNSLAANVSNFNSKDIKDNPIDLINSSNVYQVHRSLVGKLVCVQKLYFQSKDREYLEMAEEIIPILHDASALLFQKPNNYNDRFQYQNYLALSNQAAIRIYHELWNVDGDEKYLNLIYKEVERNKSNLIIASLQENAQFSETSEVPDSLLFERETAMKKISLLESQIYAQGESENADQEAIKLLSDELFAWRKKESQINDFMKANYTQYYDWRLDRFYLSLDQAQQELLSADEIMYEYHLTENELLLFKVTKETTELIAHDLNEEFYTKLDRFLALCHDPATSFAEYLNLSQYLVDHIGLDSEELKKYNKLLIVPDGVLGLIPFGALALPSESKPEGFDQVNYLINEITIAYANSASLLSLQESRDQYNRVEAVAFAPSNAERGEVAAGSDAVRDGLVTLTWTENEINNLGEHFKTAAYLGNEATEQQFKQSSKGVSIVHVAGHGLIDDNNPLFSKLVFSATPEDSLNDGYVNTRELYDMKIPADMVVLSACNSGAGGLVTGEGVISLANGFFYAGSKSAVMTLWQANDESSAAVMNLFYQSLASGMDKSEALRTAKLKYLEEADQLRAHPYFWAHFVANGDDRPLAKAGMSPYLWFLLLIPLMIFLTRKARRQKAN